MKTILATGGLGFVGSHTCAVLLQKGYDVLVIDSLVNSSEDILKNLNKILKRNENKQNLGTINFVKGDVRNRNLLNHIFAQYKDKNEDIEAVIHFAGLKSVSESVTNPLNYWDVNINATLNLLSVMRDNNCFNFIFSSSATVYLPKNHIKLKEYDQQYPNNPYGNTKFTIEKILQDVFRSDPTSWNILNLRYFNPAGAHSTALIGEIPFLNSSNLFPVIMNVILGRLEKLSIYGNDWPTKDGTCIRDFIHVMDLASAHYEALKFVLKNTSQINSINIGTGEGISILEVVNAFLKKDVNLPFEFVERRIGDSHYVVADNSLALDILKWKPIKNLDDMCKDSLNWLNFYKTVKFNFEEI